jgi:hypothetical protein
MAEYKGIKGFKVQTVSTDPAASAIAGGTWASGGDLNTSKIWEWRSGNSNCSFILMVYSSAVNALLKNIMVHRGLK